MAKRYPRYSTEKEPWHGKSHARTPHTRTYLTDFRIGFLIMALQFFAIMGMQGMEITVAFDLLQLASIVTMYVVFECIAYADDIPDEAGRREIKNLIIPYVVMIVIQTTSLVISCIVQNIMASVCVGVIIIELTLWMRKHIIVSL